jgi:hypothetical protein
MNTVMLKNHFKFIFSFLFVFLLTSLTQAQNNDCKPFDFNLVPSYHAGQNTFAYTTADFNGDGFMDVSVINSDARTVSVLFGDGAGGFGAPQIFPTEINPWSIASGDLNSDGKQDLIVASFYENKFAVLLNNGNGGFAAPNVFTPPSQFPNQGQFYDLKTADFNGDGNLDVVAVQNQQGKQLKFFLGNGQGALTLSSTLNVQGDETVIAVGNLNGDNLPDIVLSGGSSFVSRYVSYVYGQASGNFSLVYGFQVEEKPVGFKIARLNADAHNDLAIAFEDTTTPTSHFLRPYLSNGGSGSFTAGTKIDVVYFLPPSDITVGDYNGDGKTDIAAPLSSGIIMVNHGVGDGTYQTPNYYAVPSGFNALFTQDLNQDNKQDLIVVQRNFISANVVSVLINQNNNGFKAPKPLLWAPQNIDAGDFNSDGYKDLVSAWNTSFNEPSTVDIALNDLNGGLLEETGPVTPAALKTMKVGDFNGDGKLDAVTAHTNNGRQLAVYLGNGLGALAPFVSTSLNVAFENIIVGEFNSDGKDDVFAVDSSGRGYSLLSSGNGAFTTAPNFPVTLQGNLLKLGKGDFNNDAKLDLIISNGSIVNLWLGDGTGQFALSPNSLASLGDVVVGDFNGDNNLDVAGFGAGEVKAYLGNGSGGFGQSFSIAAPTSNTRSLISEDFNLDGYDDLAYTVVLNNSGNLVFVPSGGQNASWKQPISFSVGGLDGYFSTIIAADFNADNKPDIAYNAGTSRGVIYNTAGLNPCVSVNDVTVTEGDGGATVAANFTVSLSAASAQDVYVNYSLEGQSAIVGTDVQNTSGRLKIPAGQTSATVSVPVAGDLLDEFDETFIVRLASPANASITKATGTGTIIDNDAAPTLTISDASATEGFFTGGITFNITLSAPSGKPISFRWTTADGSAVAGSDYIAGNNVQNVQPGTTSANVSVTMLGDNMHELTEDFFLNISEAVNVSLTDNQGKATIVNDDPVPTVSIFGSTAPEGDTGTFTGTLNLQLSNPTYLPVTLNVLTSDGTAVSGRDYVAADTPMTIPAQQTTVSVNYQVVGDTINEPIETFFLNVYNISNATVVNPQTQISIIDDEFISNDYDRDGKTDVAVFRPSDRTWYILFSSNGSFTGVQYGLSDDVPVSGDYSGDGRTDIAVWRPSNGYWYTSVPNRTQNWGASGDIPVAGDYDNDGRIDVAVFRPSDKTWYIQLSSNGAVKAVQFGIATDVPVPADYDGDGKTDIAVYRPENGTWYGLRSSDDQFFGMQFGIAADKPVAADYDGDGKADIAVFRDGDWYVSRSSDGVFTAFHWGAAGDKPVPGNYDGDDKSDFAVYRNGDWYIFQSATNTYVVKQFGLPEDIPIPSVSRN